MGAGLSCRDVPEEHHSSSPLKYAPRPSESGVVVRGALKQSTSFKIMVPQQETESQQETQQAARSLNHCVSFATQSAPLSDPERAQSAAGGGRRSLQQSRSVQTRAPALPEGSHQLGRHSSMGRSQARQDFDLKLRLDNARAMY
ncbi:hypothetical protein FOA52_015604 [Chlamydomonas sp. UWO 241]|nr:hypothetical protein FOA52_015604 [Chlamydomonas sp. UWO 241]